MEPEIRLGTPTDLATLVACCRDFYSEEHIDYDEVAVTSAFAELLHDRSLGYVCVVEADAAVVGYLVLAYGFIVEFGGRLGYVDEFYVRPQFRSRGYGGRMLEFVETTCRAEGIRVLRLEADCSNAEAIALYKRLGYILHERFTMTRLLR